MGRRALLDWAGAALLLIVLVILTPRITKYQTNHIYADRRNFLGFPNTLNVFSAFPFLLVGCTGAVLCLHGNYFGLSSQEEIWGWSWFFTAVTLSAFGSAYYHLRPSDSRLIWDCFPMTNACLSIMAVFVGEKLDELKGFKSSLPLLLAGVFTVVYWWLADDIQLFRLMQFIPAIAVPVMTVTLPPKYTQSWYWMWATGMYFLSQLAEAHDGWVYRMTRFLVSGHTVKHLATAMVPVFIMFMLAHRNVKIERLTV